MLRVKDVAEKHGVTDRTVRRWLTEGLPYTKFRSSILIDPKELEEWEKGQKKKVVK